MTVNKLAVEDAAIQLLLAIGDDPARPGLVDTPQRVSRSFAEIFSGLDEDPAQHLHKIFHVDSDELVMVKDIPFYSMCEHHLLPFFGNVHVAYLPKGGRITGLSKLARTVDGFARRPQVQERLTAQVADAVENVLEPYGVAVVVEAEHLCMQMRGVQKRGATAVTSTFRGQLAKKSGRQEVLDLIGR